MKGYEQIQGQWPTAPTLRVLFDGCTNQTVQS